MASFQIFFVSTFFFFLHNTALRAKICETLLSCDGYASDFRIKFPFQLNTTTSRSTQAKSCGYPGFNLSYNNQRQTILTLPYSGDFASCGWYRLLWPITLCQGPRRMPFQTIPKLPLHYYGLSFVLLIRDRWVLRLLQLLQRQETQDWWIWFGSLP